MGNKSSSGLAWGWPRWRWQLQPAYRLLLLWLGVLILPAMLTQDLYMGPSTVRMFGAAPAIYLLIGVGIWEAFRYLSVTRICQKNKIRIAITLGAAVSALILLQGVNTHRTYFQYWNTRFPQFVGVPPRWRQIWPRP